MLCMLWLVNTFKSACRWINNSYCFQFKLVRLIFNFWRVPVWNELNYELNKYQLKRTHILTANNGPEKTLHFAYMQPVKETRNPRTEPGMDSTFFLPRRKFRKSSSCAKDKSAALTTKTNRKLQFRLSSLWIEFFTLGANYRSRGNTECLLHMGLNIMAFCYQFFFFFCDEPICL